VIERGKWIAPLAIALGSAATAAAFTYWLVG
jgi:hypothetical protein